MSRPEVSVVMSVYNDERYLREAMESILSQTGVEFEFIIVDDGSTDSSPEILATFAASDPRIRFVRQENSGLTKALIRGCKLAQGEFIARQDADDLSLPGRLQSQAELLRSDASLDFVSCQAEVIAPTGEVVVRHTRPTSAKESTELLLHGGSGPPGHGSVMFRRSTYQNVGGYREEFYFAQDCDLWFRLAEKGQLNYSSDFLYQYRLDPASLSGARSPIKQEFARAVDECRQLRIEGKSEDLALERCRSLRSRVTEKVASSESRTLYFLGRNLLASHPWSAGSYLMRAISRNPFHLKAWLSLCLVPLHLLRRAVG